MSNYTQPVDATSYKKTSFGIIPRKELVKKEAEGLAKGFGYILNIKQTLPLTPRLLLKLHRICFGWIFPDWAGKLRKIDVETSSHQFPHFYDVSVLTKRLFDDLNERLRHQYEPVELIAWVHHAIVWIHPFQDYNGRIARLFSNLLMLRLGLPLVEIKVESENERKQYIAAIKKADSGDYSQLENLIRKSLKENDNASPR